jgi:predicted transposase YdaD
VTAKPFDPTLKALVETEPESWPALLGRPTGPTAVIDADIATVSGAADKVLHVSATQPYLLHLEFVAGHDAATLPRKLIVRNALLDDRHDLPVRTAVILLRPEADSPQLTGTYQRSFRGEEAYHIFRYQVVRVWRLSPEALLTGGLPLVPLALISAVTEPQLPGIMERIEKRLSGRRGRAQAQVVWAAAYVLLGLRYSPDLSARLFRGVVSMKESSTYRAILAEGREEGREEGAVIEARKLLRLLGDAPFGKPDTRTIALIDGIDDLDKLEELATRVRTATSWEEVFNPPTRRKGKRKGSP